MKNKLDYDVIIIGLGPTGGVLANLLMKNRISTMILEKEENLYNLPRAVHFDDEVMRVFETIGIVSNFEKKVIINKGTRFYNEDNQLLLDWPRPKKITENGWYPSYRFHQPDLEKNLRRKLYNNQFVKIRQSSNVIDIESFKNYAQVKFKDTQTKKIKSLTSKYVVGCDGGNSFVRGLISPIMDDLGFEQKWIVIDVLLKNRNISLPDRTIQYCSSSRPATYCRNVGRRRRWEIALKNKEDEKKFNEDFYLWKYLKKWISREDAELERKAIYTFKSKIAQKWRKDRIFLAGDAAHLSPPFMGQGMCAGIRDVSNLSWKLTYCCRRGNDEKLLNSYQSERYSNVKEYIKTTMKMGKLLNEIGDINVTSTVRTRGNGINTMSSIKPKIGKGLGKITDKNRGKVFPNLSVKNIKLDREFDGDLILISKKPIKNKKIKNICSLNYNIIEEILKQFNSEALIVRPDRYILSSTKNKNLHIFLNKTLSTNFSSLRF